MKALKNKTILNITTIIVIILLGITSYYTYLSYKKYDIEKNSIKVSSFIYEIEFTLSKLEQERMASVEYLVTLKDTSYQKLEKSRLTVDISLKKLEILLKECSRYNVSFGNYINSIRDELKLAREEIDDVGKKHESIFFNAYHTKVFAIFSEILNNLSLVEKSKDIRAYLSIYEKYTALRENSLLEHLGISYALMSSQKMSDLDISLWKQLISEDTLPRFNRLSDKDIILTLKGIVLEDEYSSVLAKDREMILYEAKVGDYSVSRIGWQNHMNKKMDYIIKSQSLIQNKIEENDEWSLMQSMAIVLSFAFVTLLLLYMFFKLTSMYFVKYKNSSISEETLRDIALVFNAEQQKEITRLIKDGKVDHIYKFLIKAIKDANQTKDLFLASMSHEVRTPLNGIVGFTSLLKESDNKEEQAEFISVIEKSSVNLLNIVNDILDLSKVKAQKIELESIEFDPISTFESAVESYAAKAAEENIDFNIFLDPALPTLLMGDPTKMSQIIVNLVSNAVKFTPKNGEVNVNIEKLSDKNDEVEIKFEVSDTGIGITKEQKKNIFEAFTQADVSTSRKYGGTGLGLSISGKFVELMGGKLSIWSEKDKGTTFYFTLRLIKPKSAQKRVVEDMRNITVGVLDPHHNGEYHVNKNLDTYIRYTGAKIIHYKDETLLAIKGSSKLPDILFIDHSFRYRRDEIQKFLGFKTKTVVISTGEQKETLKLYKSKIDKIIYKPVNLTKTLRALSSKEEKQETQKVVTFRGIHVLVAEDNRINQKLILNVLNRLGIEVTIANNGQEALDKRKEYDYDMIFMDIQMPVMGGMEATGNILSFERSNGKEHIPIMALTANAVAGNREEYIGAGMDGFLSKPLELDKLNAVLQEYFPDKIVEP